MKEWKIFITRLTTLRIRREAKRSILLCFLLAATCIKSSQVTAQESMGYFNSITVGAGISTKGIEFDLATPIGNYLALRGGISIMPNFNHSEDLDVNIPYHGTDYYSTIDTKGTLKRTSGQILLNVYLSSKGKFFLCGGVSFGGTTLLKIKGHTDNEELLSLIREGKDVNIGVGDYSIPVNENGDISGGLKIASLRPYIGIGTGRAALNNRIGFTFDMGVEFNKKPKVYTDFGNMQRLEEKANNGVSDVISVFTVYPVIRFRLCGRIF